MTQCTLTRVFFVHGLETINALGGFASADDQQPSCHGVQGPCMPNLQHCDDEYKTLADHTGMQPAIQDW